MFTCYFRFFICITIRITNRCDFLYYVFISFFSRLFPTCFGPSWAHHQGYFRLLFLCCHLVHAVLCWSSACVSGLVCGGTCKFYLAPHAPPPQKKKILIFPTKGHATKCLSRSREGTAGNSSAQ